MTKQEHNWVSLKSSFGQILNRLRHLNGLKIIWKFQFEAVKQSQANCFKTITSVWRKPVSFKLVIVFAFSKNSRWIHPRRTRERADSVQQRFSVREVRLKQNSALEFCVRIRQWSGYGLQGLSLLSCSRWNDLLIGLQFRFANFHLESNFQLSIDLRAAN